MFRAQNGDSVRYVLAVAGTPCRLRIT
jgi:hypothetical protein